MFRIIVISLFVANLLLVGFEASKPPVQTQLAASVTKTGGTQEETADTHIPETADTHIPTIHLFSELMADQDLMSGHRQCFTVGPFHDKEDMIAVRNRLQETSLSTRDRQTQALVEKGYWVFLRPYRSLLEANEVLFALQGLGLKDASVMYDGEYRNSISLGYFLRQENALKRKQGLEARGYEPLMRVKRQAEPRYWLDYEQNPGSALITLDMHGRPNDFMQRSLPCPEQGLFETTVAESQQHAESKATTSADVVIESEDG